MEPPWRNTCRVLVISVFFIGLSTSMTVHSKRKIEGDAAALAQSFIQQHELTVRPLEREAALAWWNANVSGKDQDFKAKEDAQNRLDAALSDHARFDRLKAIKEAKLGRCQTGTPDRRPLSDLPGKTGRSRTPETDHRQGQRHREDFQRLSRQRERSDDDRQRGAARFFKESRDSAERKAVWEGSKGVGPLVEADLKALVSCETRRPRSSGFADYHKLQLHLERAVARAGPHAIRRAGRPDTRAVPQAQVEVDAKLAEQSGVAVDDLRPGITTIRSSRKRRPFSPPISTRFTRKPTSSSSAATFTPGSACRSTT